MGQGTESAGGYEITYDPAYEGLTRSIPQWNDSIPVTQMSFRHLKNALRFARNMAVDSDFDDYDNQWVSWVHILESEISRRPEPEPAKYTSNIKKRGKTKRMRCHCGNEYDAREVDLKRGYAKSCSKRCAAIRREFGKPAGREVK